MLLRFLYSAKSRPYDFCIRRRAALRIPVFGEELPLRFLYSAKSRPYLFCIRQGDALTFAVFGADLPLRFLYLAKRRLYDSCIQRGAALTISVFGAEWVGVKVGCREGIRSTGEPEGETGKGIHVQTVWCGVHRAQSPSHGRCLVHIP